MILVHDGSWKGFCTVLNRLVKEIVPERFSNSQKADGNNTPRNIALPLIVSPTALSKDLFDPPIIVKADPQKAGQFKEFITSNYGQSVFHLVHAVFRTADEDKERCIARYLSIICSIPAEARNVQNPVVMDMVNRRKRVLNEMHKYFGILRFAETENGVLVSSISPDNAILDLLTPFFRARFANFCWVIVDEKRNWSAFWDTKKLRYSKVAPPTTAPDNTVNSKEEHFVLLWKTYFKHIAIEERKNPKLQTAFVPERYRQHMIEFDQNF